MSRVGLMSCHIGFLARVVGLGVIRRDGRNTKTGRCIHTFTGNTDQQKSMTQFLE